MANIPPIFPGWHYACCIYGKGRNVEREIGKMKKIALLILIMSSAILLNWVSGSYAAEFLGYTMVPKQVKFYTIILGMLGASAGMVATLYATLGLADLRKKRKAKVVGPAPFKDTAAFGDEVAIAAQPAR